MLATGSSVKAFFLFSMFAIIQNWAQLAEAQFGAVHLAFSLTAASAQECFSHVLSYNVVTVAVLENLYR